MSRRYIERFPFKENTLRDCLDKKFKDEKMSALGKAIAEAKAAKPAVVVTPTDTELKFNTPLDRSRLSLVLLLQRCGSVGQSSHRFSRAQYGYPICPHMAKN